MAHFDALTGLVNRVQFTNRLEHAQATIKKLGKCIAIICIDLDHFKDVNDTMGHDIGDKLLQAIAKRVQHELREDDIFSRLGGDEFAIIRDGISQPQEAGKLAQRIVEVISSPFTIDGHEIVVGASAGITICSPDHIGDDPNQLLREADIALYSAKTDGRGTYHFFKEEMNVRLRERKNLENDLRVALHDKQFLVYYQPQVDAATHRIVGVEALVRWKHPTRGLVRPIDFIDIAEETGLIRDIGKIVLETACADIGEWRDMNLAVNLSSVQFRRNDISKIVSDILKDTNFDPSRLELEITRAFCC